MVSERQIELFYLGDERVPVGALVTATDPGKFYCHIRFSTPDGGLVDNEAIVRKNGSVRDWTAFTYRGEGSECSGTRDGDGVRVAGRHVHHDGSIIPSYSASALVAEMARTSEDEIDFFWLTESAASPDAVVPARLERAGEEDVASPVAGTIADCQRVELLVDGTRSNTYWLKGGAVVATDWSGARSFALPAHAASNLRVALGLGM